MRHNSLDDDLRSLRSFALEVADNTVYQIQSCIMAYLLDERVSEIKVVLDLYYPTANAPHRGVLNIFLHTSEGITLASNLTSMADRPALQMKLIISQI